MSASERLRESEKEKQDTPFSEIHKYRD